MARLFVIFARDAHVAVVLRRGPAAWYHVIRWDTAHDAFEHGAWFRGRIYEPKCDVSPDGTLLLAFVHQGRRAGTASTHAWTAVSRLPWLHALALWPHGTTYGGGGRFTGDRSLCLRGGDFRDTHPERPAHGLTASEGSNPPVHASAELVDDADWSGLDPHHGVVFTRGTKLFRRAAHGDTLLADFAALTPDPQPAPEWARASLATARTRKQRGHR